MYVSLSFLLDDAENIQKPERFKSGLQIPLKVYNMKTNRTQKRILFLFIFFRLMYMYIWNGYHSQWRI